MEQMHGPTIFLPWFCAWYLPRADYKIEDNATKLSMNSIIGWLIELFKTSNTFQLFYIFINSPNENSFICSKIVTCCTSNHNRVVNFFKKKLKLQNYWVKVKIMWGNKYGNFCPLSFWLPNVVAYWCQQVKVNNLFFKFQYVFDEILA